MIDTGVYTGAASGPAGMRDLERDPSVAFPSNTPRLSVVVPAHNSSADLRHCLDALDASDLPRATWELIVVDDSSDDSTPDVAQGSADHVIRLTGALAAQPSREIAAPRSRTLRSLYSWMRTLRFTQTP